MLFEGGGGGPDDLTGPGAEDREEREGDVVADDDADGVAGDGDVEVVVALVSEELPGNSVGIGGYQGDGVSRFEEVDVEFLGGDS